MKEYLHLFTDVKEALPKNNQKVAFISTSKDGAIYEGLGTFFEKDQWQRENVFIGDGYHFIDSNQFPERNWNVTHWLDLSKLTTKERVEKEILDAECLMPIELFGRETTKKEYGRFLINVLLEEIKPKL